MIILNKKYVQNILNRGKGTPGTQEGTGHSSLLVKFVKISSSIALFHSLEFSQGNLTSAAVILTSGFNLLSAAYKSPRKQN